MGYSTARRTGTASSVGPGERPSPGPPDRHGPAVGRCPAPRQRGAEARARLRKPEPVLLGPAGRDARYAAVLPAAGERRAAGPDPSRETRARRASPRRDGGHGTREAPVQDAGRARDARAPERQTARRHTRERRQGPAPGRPPHARDAMPRRQASSAPHATDAPQTRDRRARDAMPRPRLRYQHPRRARLDQRQPTANGCTRTAARPHGGAAAGHGTRRGTRRGGSAAPRAFRGRRLRWASRESRSQQDHEKIRTREAIENS